jgi:predicted metal-dependent HD superfamily phosphohydrolase
MFMPKQPAYRPGEEEVIASLHADWERLTDALAVNKEIGEAFFRDIIQAYCAPDRFYHRPPHLHQMLDIIATYKDQAGCLGVAELAVWFHDFVYDSRARDNEERSAQAAGQMLAAMQIPANLISSVQTLILQTKTHQPDANDLESRIFLDADLAILGAALVPYKGYARAIRQEYAWVPEAEYRLGRAQVLRNFLERPRIYLTDAMFAEREERARANLQWEIHVLQQEDPVGGERKP